MISSLALPVVEPLDETLRSTLQHLIDTKTKPPGSLGRLETLARQMGLIQRTTHPTVQRPAMSNARIVSPVYSMTWPLPPDVVILPMIASTTSLAEQPKPSVPETSICIFFAGRCNSV